MVSSFHLLPKHVMSKSAKICLAQALGAPEPVFSLARGTLQPHWLQQGPKPNWTKKRSLVNRIGTEGSRTHPAGNASLAMGDQPGVGQHWPG